MSHLRDLSNSSLSPEEEKFAQLCTKAKELCKLGQPEDIRKALNLYCQAFKLRKSDKLKKRIDKLKAFLDTITSEDEEEETDGSDEVAHVGDGFYLYKPLYDSLYAHQREGVLFLYRLFRLEKGGILGDDMGLGKTIQVCAFLSGMFDAQRIKSVLIIVPVALIVNWTKEFEKWAPGLDVSELHSQSNKDRVKLVSRIHQRGGVCLTSYGIVVANEHVLTSSKDREIVWDYVILDEGHKIKNPSTKAAKAVHSIRARNRIVLSGTPLMNGLKELWALFDWAHEGQLLGSARTFAMQYDSHITRARQKDATAAEQRLGNEMSQSLQKLIAPYFLRRTKQDVHKIETEEGSGSAPHMPTMTRKNDLICWVILSEVQQKIYRDFIITPAVKELLNSSRSPLTALTVLKKICDHPRLLKNRQCEQLGMSVCGKGLTPLQHIPKMGTYDSTAATLWYRKRFGDVVDFVLDLDAMDRMVEEDSTNFNVDHIADETLIAESGKLVFLVELLDNLKSEGHRCLVFSLSRKVLDIIQKIMRNRGHKICRLDGTIRKLEERQQIIETFMENKKYSLFLLTTQVGGIGLTLTAADRVVIYDPSWNPATDSQAVDRAFRIGQNKNVVIYRLITCGSVEEKIYRRQIFKDSINKMTTGDSKNPYRYFSKQELYQLFELDDPHYSETQKQLQDMYFGKRKTDTSMDDHIAFLHSLAMVGISDHDLMFTKEAVNDEVDDEALAQQFVQNHIAKAQELLSRESEENRNLAQQLGRYPGGGTDDPRVKARTKVNEEMPNFPRVEKSTTPTSVDSSDDERFYSKNKNIMSSTLNDSDAEVEKSLHDLILGVDGNSQKNGRRSADDDDNDSDDGGDNDIDSLQSSTPEKHHSIEEDEIGNSEDGSRNVVRRHESMNRESMNREPLKSPYRVVKEELMFSPHSDRPLIDLAQVEGEDVVEMEEEDHCSTAPKVRVSSARRASTARRLQQSFEDSPIVVSGKVRKNIIYSDEENESDKENEISRRSQKINQNESVSSKSSKSSDASDHSDHLGQTEDCNDDAIEMETSKEDDVAEAAEEDGESSMAEDRPRARDDEGGEDGGETSMVDEHQHMEDDEDDEETKDYGDTEDGESRDGDEGSRDGDEGSRDGDEVGRDGDEGSRCEDLSLGTKNSGNEQDIVDDNERDDDEEEDDGDEEDDESDDDDEEEDGLDDESTAKYLQLINTGKSHYAKKNYAEALESFKAARNIWTGDDRIVEFMQKLARKLGQE